MDKRSPKMIAEEEERMRAFKKDFMRQTENNDRISELEAENTKLKFDLKEITGGLKDRIIELETQLATAKTEIKKWEGFYKLLESRAEYAHTWFWDEHPEDYNDPCLCVTCRSYMADDCENH